MSASPDIFLSYNREDAEVARRFAEGFEAQGFDVWWDQALRSGEAYDEVTEAALRGAKAVVALWSPRSVVSRWVRAEATLADRNRTLVPARIEACDLPIMFELTQTADLSHWQGAPDDRTWQAFLDDVRRMVGPEAPETVKPASPSSASADAGGPSIVAVLPLVLRGDDSEMEILAEDLIEEITRELARNRYFEVIATGRMASWHGKAVDHGALGQELGARYLVEGKLQRGGEDARLTIQIIDPASGKILWSQRLARKLDEIVSTPDEFPLAAATQLGERIMQMEVSRAMANTGPASAWDHLLRLLGFMGHAEIEGVAKCSLEARAAVAAAPDLALAHAALAAMLGAPLMAGIKDLDDSTSREIRTHATRAFQLDGNDPLVLAQLAVAYNALGDGESTLRLAKRVLDRDPNSVRGHGVLGGAYMSLGRTNDAISAFVQMEGATGYEPGHYAGLAWLGMCYLLQGQLEEAEAALDRSLALHPDFNLALALKAIIEAERGGDLEALATVKHLREAERGKTIEQYERMLNRYPHYRGRMTEHTATLRRLWDATEGVS